MKTLVYADYAAATPTDPKVADKVRSVSLAVIGNPSSAHGFGQTVAAELNQARQTVAKFLNALPSEIIFTASGTESNNMTILGVARANKHKGQHLITTQIEHPSVMNACRALEKDGWQVTYLPVDKNGQISAKALKKAITKETALFSIHYGNSELGILPDIKTLATICREHGVLVHVDACQATAFEKLDVNKLGVDLLTFNGSKMYGPKGTAVLFVRDGVTIFPIMYGGGQEQSLRSGTENVPGVAGLAEAIKIIEKQRAADVEKIDQLRHKLQTDLEKLPNVVINAKGAKRLPNHLSITFNNLKNVDLVQLLDEQGIAVSAGSACSSKSLGESHVLKAIGLTSEQAQATVRVSLGRQTTTRDCTKIYQAVAGLIK